MAEQKRVTRKGVRQMMRPKPRRVTGRDPCRPPPPRTEGGVGWYLVGRHRASLIMADEGNTPFDYAALERLLLTKYVDVVIHDTAYVPVEWSTVSDGRPSLHNVPKEAD